MSDAPDHAQPSPEALPDDEPTAPPEPSGGPLFNLDPGWLFLGAGLALIAATVLIPAVSDLRDAQHNRSRALAVETFRKERLDNYASYLDALRSHDPTLIRSLAATQLNLAPSDRQAMLNRAEAGLPSANVFASLEPKLKSTPPRREPSTLLQRWTTDEKRRVWLIAIGALSILVGLLPASKQRRPISEL